jgi:hypothetical protein
MVTVSGLRCVYAHIASPEISHVPHDWLTHLQVGRRQGVQIPNSLFKREGTSVDIAKKYVVFD